MINQSKSFRNNSFECIELMELELNKESFRNKGAKKAFFMYSDERGTPMTYIFNVNNYFAFILNLKYEKSVMLNDGRKLWKLLLFSS